MFQFLTEKIRHAFKKFRGNHKITAQNIAPTLKEIRRALVAADVHYNVAKAFVNTVKEKSVGIHIKIATSPGELFTKILHEELTLLMGSEKAVLRTNGKPAIILLIGLQGVGKTTLAGKLANHIQSQGKKILLTSCDVHRPAAMEQLEKLAKDLQIDIYLNKTTKDPLQIAKEALNHARIHHQQVVIIDTAGRQTVDKEMMAEITTLKQACKPTETLFVVDAMMGQAAVDTAYAFDQAVAFDGVVLTKMDGDTRGGAALTIRKITGKPIKLVSAGEKMMDLDPFYPDRMARRILGMGDVLSLVEKAEQTFNKQEAQRLQKKLKKRQLDFNDFRKQIKQVRKMGTFTSLLSAIPGIRNFLKQAPVDEKVLKEFEVMIQSMTPKERAQPGLLDQQRLLRIAIGSGLGNTKVNQLYKQFQRMRQLVKKGQHEKLVQDMTSDSA